MIHFIKVLFLMIFFKFTFIPCTSFFLGKAAFPKSRSLFQVFYGSQSRYSGNPSKRFLETAAVRNICRQIPNLHTKDYKCKHGGNKCTAWSFSLHSYQSLLSSH